MSRGFKRGIVLIAVVAVTAILLCLLPLACAEARGVSSGAETKAGGVADTPTEAGTNGNVDVSYDAAAEAPLGAVAISTDDQLKAFMHSDRSINEQYALAEYGYLTKDVRLVANYRMGDKFVKTFDGAGHTVTLVPNKNADNQLIINTDGNTYIGWEGGNSSLSFPGSGSYGVQGGGNSDEVVTWGRPLYAGGCIAGSLEYGRAVRNANFVFAGGECLLNNIQADDIATAMSFGVLFGANCGIIDNCSLTFADSASGDASRLYMSRQGVGDDKGEVGSIEKSVNIMGGFVGINAVSLLDAAAGQGGIISNCLLNTGKHIMAGDGSGRDVATLEIYAIARAWHSYAAPVADFHFPCRAFVGGVAGLNYNGGTIFNLTITGAGKIRADATTKDSLSNNNRGCFAGGVAGVNFVHKDIMLGKSDGVIDGVICGWTGYVKYFIMAELKGQFNKGKTYSYYGGIMTGVSSSEGVRNIYYVADLEAYAPKTADVQKWNSDDPGTTDDSNYGAAVSGYPGVGIATNAVQFYLNDELVDVVALDEATVLFAGTTREADLEIAYEVSEEAGSMLWNVSVTNNGATLDEKTYYDQIDSIKGAAAQRNWKYPFARAASNGAAYNMDIKLFTGHARYYKVDFSGAKSVSEDGRVATYEGREYDGNFALDPTIKFYSDAQYTSEKESFQGVNYFRAYKNGVYTDLSLDDTKNAGDWEIFPIYSSDTIDPDFDNSTRSYEFRDNAKRVVAYAKDNEFYEAGNSLWRPSMKITISPKSVTPTFATTPSDFIYNNTAAAFEASVPANQLVGEDKSGVTLSYFNRLEDGEYSPLSGGKAVKAGKYSVMPSGVTNPNYRIANEQYYDFDIQKRRIAVEFNDLDNLVFNGLVQKATYVIAQDASKLTPEQAASNVIVTNILADETSFVVTIDFRPEKVGYNYVDVGKYTVSVVMLTTSNAENYDLPEVITKEVVIAKATPIIDVADITVGYDGTNHPVTATIEGQNGAVISPDVTYFDESGTAIKSAPRDAGKYTASVSFAADFYSNYEPVTKTVNVQINKASVTIGPDSNKYGDIIGAEYTYNGAETRLPEDFFVVSGLVPTDVGVIGITGIDYKWFRYDGEEMSQSGVGVDCILNAGKYVVKPIYNLSGNYILLSDTGFEVVNGRLTVSIDADTLERTYGDEIAANNAFVYTGEGRFADKDGITAALSSTAATQYAAAGNYDFDGCVMSGGKDVDLEYDFIDNYVVVYGGGRNKLTIARRVVNSPAFGIKQDGEYAVRASYNAETRTAVTDYVFEGFEGIFVYKSADGTIIDGGVKDVGEYTVEITLSDEAKTKFEFGGTTSVGFGIDKAAVTVDVNDGASMYGETVNPDVGASITGTFFAVDNVAYTTSVIDGAAAVGTYEIGLTFVANDRLVNYDVVVNKGTYTVSPRAVTIVPDDATITYGDEIPTLTWKYAEGSLEFITDDNVTVNADAGVLKFGAAGEYTSTLTTDADAGNYIVTCQGGKFTVQKRELNGTVTTPTDGKYSGSAFDASAASEAADADSGIVNDDIVNVLFSYNGESSAVAAANYTVTVSGVDNDNYVIGTFTFANGDSFEISKLNISVTLADGARDFGSLALKLSDTPYTYDEGSDALVDTDIDGGTLAVEFYCELAADAAIGEHAGALKARLTGDAAVNYTFVATAAAVTIGAYDLTSLTLKEDTATYTGEDLSAKIAFNLDVDDVEALIVTFEYEAAAVDKIVDAGTYTVNVAGDDTKFVGNVALTFTVGKADRMLSADALDTIVNYNKITVKSDVWDVTLLRAGLESDALGSSNAITSGIAEQNTYKIYVGLAEDKNFKASNVVEIGELETGADPTRINAIMDGIGKFGFGDIATLDDVHERIKGVHEVDMDALDVERLNALDAEKQTLIDACNSVISETQNAAKNMAGGGAAAAAAALTVGGAVLLMLKKKALL